MSSCQGGLVEINAVDTGGNRAPSGGGQAGNTSSGATGGTAGGFVLPPSVDAAVAPTSITGCGDGQQTGSEQCDDGNTESGDGCNRICQMEGNFICPEPGKPCQNIAKCGNALVTSNETCDDGNTTSGDGCAADCKSVEPGFECRVPGKPCVPKCGDGVRSGVETCDDGNTKAGDGCSATCKIEPGYGCSGSPSTCKKTVCGDKKVEGGEGCDDGNLVPFDGCSQECQIEPDCKGTSCSSKCGDTIVLGEECDDGNAASGDGCSQACKLEAGFTCEQPPLGDKMLVPVVYRDFRYHTPKDFEPGATGRDKAFTGMVNKDLDAEGKPVYTGIGGNANVESKDSFAKWYRDSAGVNHATAGKLALWNNGKGAYVNRYGENGEQWPVTTIADWCGQRGEEMLDDQGDPIPCTFRYQDGATDSGQPGGQTDCQKQEAKGLTRVSCYLEGTTYKGKYIVSLMDGNPLFFPVDKDPFTPQSEFSKAQIPPVYDATARWPVDVDDNGVERKHNFSFTSEVRYWFVYDKSKTYTLEFTGDDDVWVFINKKLAVDLGGIHTPVNGQVVINATTASSLGLSDGKAYEVAVFQAERQTTSSSYKLTLSGFNAATTTCHPTCGDGEAVAEEECDNGDENDDDLYGGCTTKCKWGTFCGDGVVNGPEECDEGKNNGAQYGEGGCTIGCTRPHFCGDGKVDTDRDEQCDMGDLNGVKLDVDGNRSESGKVHCQLDCIIPSVVF